MEPFEILDGTGIAVWFRNCKAVKLKVKNAKPYTLRNWNDHPLRWEMIESLREKIILVDLKKYLKA